MTADDNPPDPGGIRYQVPGYQYRYLVPRYPVMYQYPYQYRVLKKCPGCE